MSGFGAKPDGHCICLSFPLDVDTARMCEQPERSFAFRLVPVTYQLVVVMDSNSPIVSPEGCQQFFKVHVGKSTCHVVDP